MSAGFRNQGNDRSPQMGGAVHSALWPARNSAQPLIAAAGLRGARSEKRGGGQIARLSRKKRSTVHHKCIWISFI